MLEQKLEVGDAVVAAAGGEGVGGGERHQRGVAAGAAAGDDDAVPIGEPGLAQMAGSGGAVGDVGNAPGAIEPLAVGTPIAGAAGIIHVEHGEAAARIELNARLEAGVRHGGRAAVREDEGGRR